MDFYKVVDDVLALLRGRGRVTYRALKVQFQLDDEQLEALKEEVLYAKKLAVDEENRVLVWVGEQATTPPTPPPPRPESTRLQQLSTNANRLPIHPNTLPKKS